MKVNSILVLIAGHLMTISCNDASLPSVDKDKTKTTTYFEKEHKSIFGVIE